MQIEQPTPRRVRVRRDVERREPRAQGSDGHATGHETPRPLRHLELAADALLAGLTREQCVAALVDRIERDAHYLAYRKARRRHTRYDEQVAADLGAIALAICWLSEAPGRGGPGLAPGDATAGSSQVVRRGPAPR